MGPSFLPSSLHLFYFSLSPPRGSLNCPSWLSIILPARLRLSLCYHDVCPPFPSSVLPPSSNLSNESGKWALSLCSRAEAVPQTRSVYHPAKWNIPISKLPIRHQVKSFSIIYLYAKYYLWWHSYSMKKLWFICPLIWLADPSRALNQLATAYKWLAGQSI